MNKDGGGSLAGKKVGTHFLLLFYKKKKVFGYLRHLKVRKEDGFIKKDLLKGGPEMNISGKRTSRLLSLSLAGSMLIGLMTTGVSAVEPAQDQELPQTTTVTDAILYTVDEAEIWNTMWCMRPRIANTVQVALTRAVASTHWTSWIPFWASRTQRRRNSPARPIEDRTLGDAVVADLTITGDEITAIEVTEFRSAVIGISWKKDGIWN